jgi:hypothetical protein
MSHISLEYCAQSQTRWQEAFVLHQAVSCKLITNAFPSILPTLSRQCSSFIFRLRTAKHIFSEENCNLN